MAEKEVKLMKGNEVIAHLSFYNGCQKYEKQSSYENKPHILGKIIYYCEVCQL